MMEAGPVKRRRKKGKNSKSHETRVKAKKGRSPRTIQYVFASARQVWNSAQLNGIVQGEWPCKRKKNFLPKVKNQRMRFLSDNEGNDLLAELQKRSQQLHDICLLSFDTGMRASEIFNLIWARVDLEKEQIRILDSKGRDRVVPMNRRVKQLFERLPKGKADELVFRDRNGNRITEISNSFGRAVNELGLNDGITDRRDKLVFHSLRHSFASRLVESGVDLYHVKELLGHSTLALTERYSHLRPDTLRAAVSLLDSSSDETENEEGQQGKVVGLKNSN